MSDFKAIALDLLGTKKDPEDIRLGEIVRSDSSLIPEGGWVVAGYPDDEGINLNGGRPGAALAPSAIRKYLYRCTPAVGRADSVAIVDRGDLSVETLTLGDRHAKARKESARCMSEGARWLGLGGGHDYGFPDTAGFLDSLDPRAKPLVINFDAHLDVRPTSKGFHSGTPFRRLLEEFKDTEIVAIGIQSQCNSRAHLNWLQQQGAEILFLDDLWLTGQNPGVVICERLLPRLERLRPVFISVDLDVFSSAFAPGCSQSWPYGLSPEAVMMAIDFICSRARVMGLGLYEVSPPLDIDDRTSRLAAQIAHRVLFHTGPRT